MPHHELLPLCKTCFCRHSPEGRHIAPRRSAQEWCDVTGVIVLDPDGWDRRNLDASWDERITLDTFRERVNRSTASRGALDAVEVTR